MKPVFLVYANSDNIEGKGVNVLRYICSSHDLAVELSKGLGPMGASNGDVKPDFIIDTKEELLQKTRNEKREKAMSKLTTEEQILLGLIK